MIERMEKGCDEGKRREDGHGVSPENQRHAQRNIDETNVFNTAIGQQTFQSIFSQRIQNAQYSRCNASAKYQVTPPGLRSPNHIKSEAHETVNSCLQHYRRHQSRYRTGSNRMSFGQPKM